MTCIHIVQYCNSRLFNNIKKNVDLISHWPFPCFPCCVFFLHIDAPLMKGRLGTNHFNRESVIFKVQVLHLGQTWTTHPLYTKKSHQKRSYPQISHPKSDVLYWQASITAFLISHYYSSIWIFMILLNTASGLRPPVTYTWRCKSGNNSLEFFYIYVLCCTDKYWS